MALSLELRQLAADALARLQVAADEAERIAGGMDDGWNGVRDLFGLEGTAAQIQVAERARQTRKLAVVMEERLAKLTTPADVADFVATVNRNVDVSTLVERARLLSLAGAVENIAKPPPSPGGIPWKWLGAAAVALVLVGVGVKVAR